jgi:polar amino acid transport system substrate-binding protein
LIRICKKTILAWVVLAVYGWAGLSLSNAAVSQTAVSDTVVPNTISIAVLDNFPPFSFSVRGRVVGFTIDYLALLSDKIGIPITPVPGKWEDNLSKFKNKEVDAITAISHTVERESFTWFTDPYYLIPTVVYIREGGFNYNGVKTLQGRRVGIESEIYYKPFLERYSDIEIVEIDDTSNLMKQLSFGEIDAVVSNINIGNFMIKQHMLENIVLAGKIDIPDIEDEDLRIGVRKEKKQIHALLQDAMDQVSFNEYK